MLTRSFLIVDEHTAVSRIIGYPSVRGKINMISLIIGIENNITAKVNLERKPLPLEI